MATEVKPCKCKSEYQDRQYGPGMRVHNKGKAPKTGSTPSSCTVCGAGLSKPHRWKRGLPES